jgi:hypothetical protein
MNIQHSSRSDEWYTPIKIIELARHVLGGISFDPASDEFGNDRIQAAKYLTREDDGLSSPWLGGNLFVNPPGGKTKNRSNTELFWSKLMAFRINEHSNFNHAIFLAFSLEALQTTQRCEDSILDFPICVPRNRIKFDKRDEVKVCPSHSNVIVYVPGNTDNSRLFRSVFNELGAVR